MSNNTTITMLNVDNIVPNKYQPRKIFDENALRALAESIKQYGIINPILVRLKDNKYEIIAGERRYRAAKLIGLTEVPAIIKDSNEQEMAELAVIENLQRQELSPIEEAKSYEEIMRIGNQTQDSLARKVGKSQSSIANKLRLLSLPQEIQDALAKKQISERHARSLLTVKNKESQLKLLNKIITERLTVKETDEIIKEQEVDEVEINQAISDIMKSLNIKKEEKEDDNMNNGSFFPNFEPNNQMNNNNASLNMMNMQSMNQQPNMMPEQNMAPMNQPMYDMPQVNNQMPQMVEQPVVAPQPIPMPNMMPDMNNNMGNNFMNQPPMMPEMTPVQEQPMINQEMPMGAPMINDIPLFRTQPEPPMMNQPQELNQPMAPAAEPQMNQPVEPTIPAEPISAPMDFQAPNNNVVAPPSFDIPVVDLQPQELPPVESTPLVDTPLFNPNVVMPNPNESMEPVQTPVVEAQPVIEPSPVEPQTSEDKLSLLQEFLNNNGYTYKTYGNDSENCIIIELPKN